MEIYLTKKALRKLYNKRKDTVRHLFLNDVNINNFVGNFEDMAFYNDIVKESINTIHNRPFTIGAVK